ncbi:immunity 52 family protein [Salmonella enterica]|nr:immunity 52 family protein [Salmonella enterica subsp. enterica serovar Monschaui]EKQ9065496.1 immunity 52 family protein [Salmonella enterica]
MSKLEIEIYVKESAIENNVEKADRFHNSKYEVEQILSKLLLLSEFYSGYKGHVDWFLTGNSKEDAMKRKIIDDTILSDEAGTLLFQNLQNNLPLIVEQIWNKYHDVIRFRNYVQSNTNFYLYELIINIDNTKIITDFAFNIVNKIISKMSPRLIRVETNNYSLDEKQVFPDRLPVGWMFYINKIFRESFLQLDKNARQINANGIPMGTLFISKTDFFDGANKDDVRLSNDIEIILASKDILPTYKNIFY